MSTWALTQFFLNYPINRGQRCNWRHESPSRSITPLRFDWAVTKETQPRRNHFFYAFILHPLDQGGQVPKIRAREQCPLSLGDPFSGKHIPFHVKQTANKMLPSHSIYWTTSSPHTTDFGILLPKSNQSLFWSCGPACLECTGTASPQDSGHWLWPDVIRCDHFHGVKSGKTGNEWA